MKYNILKNFFYLIIILNIIVLILLKDVLILPTIISLIDLIILIAFLTKFNFIRSIIFQIYFFYHILTVILPIFLIVLFYPCNEIKNYMAYLNLSEDDLINVTLYILFFDIFLLLNIYFFYKFPIKISNKIFKFYVFNNNIGILIIIYLISFFSKLYLINIGAWFMYIQVDLSKYPLSGIMNQLSMVDMVVLLFFSYKAVREKMTFFDYALVIIFSSISLFFAIISTSKAKLFMVLIPILLIVWNKIKKYKFILIFLLVIVLSYTPIIFKFMMYNRIHNNNTLVENIKNFVKDENSNIYSNNNIKQNIVLNRLNYQFVVAKVLKQYPMFNFKFDYIDNMIGLIPRFIWLNKPRVGIDYNKVGRELNLISQNDFKTSVGIRPLGEAYYEFGLLGIFILPILIAFILVFLDKMLTIKYWPGFLLAIILGITISIMDSFSVLIPTLVKTFLVFYILGVLTNQKFSDEIKIRFKL